DSASRIRSFLRSLYIALCVGRGPLERHVAGRVCGAEPGFFQPESCAAAAADAESDAVADFLSDESEFARAVCGADGCEPGTATDQGCESERFVFEFLWQ